MHHYYIVYIHSLLLEKNFILPNSKFVNHRSGYVFNIELDLLKFCLKSGEGRNTYYHTLHNYSTDIASQNHTN